MMASTKELATVAIRSSGWLFWGLWASLLTVYAPRGQNLPKMYFNMHLRRHARRLVPFLDPYVTIDIVNNKGKASSRGDDEESGQSSNNAYKEVEAYLTKACMRDALAFCAEGTVEGRSFSLSLREGQEVTDHFQGVTVWWLLEERCLRLMFPQRHRAFIQNDYLPYVRHTGREDLFITVDIVDEKDADRNNEDLKCMKAFEEVKAYLNEACSRDSLDLYAEGTFRGDSFLFSLRKGEEVADSFGGVTLRWSSGKIDSNSTRRPTCFLRLMSPLQHRMLVLNEYLPYVRRRGRDIMIGKRGQSLYTNDESIITRLSSPWSHTAFEHPANFNTLAMHPDKKRKIKEDLDNFRGNKEYYRRIGKPWKRGYLLYGPPGTGKSTMIAAMANHLNYDIYDIDLTSVKNNRHLRRLLVEIRSRSIVVIEDIDCSFDDVTGQRSDMERGSRSWRYNNDNDKNTSKVTLSGLLNFIDGVWSAQGGERIIVLTTNFPDKLEPALIRSGRMDMHIEMSYCCFEAFKTLAKNYLGVDTHPLFQRVEGLLQVVEITPADVAECLLRPQTDFPAGSDHGVETCIERLIKELKDKADEQPKKRRRRRH